MKRKLTCFLIMMMAMVLLGAGVARAGMFPALDAKMAAARSKSLETDRRAAAEKTVIVLKYAQNQRDLERQAAVRAAAVTKPAVSKDRGLPGPVKTAFLTPFVTVGTGIMALGAGFNYVTKSKFETPASQACRAVNTAKSQLLYHPYNVIKEFLTGFTGNTQYYDPSKLNWLGDRAQKRGPIAQMAEMAANVIPPVAASTGIVAPFLGLTVPEMAITTGAIGAVGGIGVGEAFDAAEKKLVK